MSNGYDNNNSGSMFKNDRKETDKQPDFRGSVEVDNQEYWLSAWVREAGPQAKNPGQKFFSLAFTPKNQEATGAPPASTKADDFDDDVPW